MKTQILLTILLCSLAIAGEKKAPQGTAEDESVAVTATILSPDQLRQAVGSDFDNNYIVLDVRLAPKGGKPYPVHLDDFILRSEHQAREQFAPHPLSLGAVGRAERLPQLAPARHVD